MPLRQAPAPMSAARRVVVAPREAWDEARLLDAARTVRLPRGALRPGDEVDGLVVTQVEPAPGATADASTVLEVRPTPRSRRGTLLDVAVLLDASESMGQPFAPGLTRFEAARQALRSFLGDPGRHLRLVSLFLYSRDAQLVAGPVASSGVALPEVTPRGRARTGTALNAALAYLAEHATERTAQAVLLLSDGSAESAELDRAAARAARLGIAVHVLQFSPEEDPLFRKVADATGGTLTRATLPPSFVLAFEPHEGPP